MLERTWLLLVNCGWSCPCAHALNLNALERLVYASHDVGGAASLSCSDGHSDGDSDIDVVLGTR